MSDCPWKHQHVLNVREFLPFTVDLKLYCCLLSHVMTETEQLRPPCSWRKNLQQQLPQQDAASLNLPNYRPTVRCVCVPPCCWLVPPGRSSPAGCWCRCDDIYTNDTETRCWHRRYICGGRTETELRPGDFQCWFESVCEIRWLQSVFGIKVVSDLSRWGGTWSGFSPPLLHLTSTWTKRVIICRRLIHKREVRTVEETRREI